MKRKDLYKYYIDLPLEAMKEKSVTPEKLNELLVKYQTGLNYLSSLPIHTLLERLTEHPTDPNYSVRVYAEDVNGQVLDENTVLRTGESMINNLLGNQYLYIDKRIQTLFVEIKRNGKIVRMNHNRPFSDNGVKESGMTVIHVIYEETKDRDMVVNNPVVLKPNSLLSKYIYPNIDDNGNVSIQAKLTINEMEN